jgi:hypothetical protein
MQKINPRELLHQNGLCTHCMQPWDGQTRMCESCRDRVARYLRKRKAELIAKGMCGKCGKRRPVRAGGTLCRRCIDQYSGTNNKRRAMGLCGCGKPMSEIGGVKCDECRLSRRVEQREKLGTKPWVPGGRGRPPLEYRRITVGNSAVVRIRGPLTTELNAGHNADTSIPTETPASGGRHRPKRVRRPRR